MERCPVEIVHRIAAFACVDGGFTGCSLSIVSHYMRNATQKVRYQSIALRGEERILQFVALLRPGENKLAVKHLYLSSRLGTYEWKAPDAAMDVAISHILSSAAATLVTLVIYGLSSPLRYNNQDIPTPLDFPNLRDVSLPTPYCICDDGSMGRSRFPALRRLHLCDTKALFMNSIWNRLGSFLPHLTRIRLSGVLQDTNLPRFLRVLLRLPNSNVDEAQTNGSDSSHPRIHHASTRGS